MPHLPDTADRSLARFHTGDRWRPARFSERGVVLPFTTPFLLGGRMRPAERGGAELVLAHPAGAGGVYILPWSAMPSLCAPTLHDRALWERAAAALPEFSPAAARQENVVALHYGLLLDLLRRIEPAGAAGAAPPPAPDSHSGVERRALSALGRLRQEGGPPPATAMAALGEIACALEGCGLRAEGGKRARLPRLAAGLADMAAEMEAAAGQAPDDAKRAGLRLLAESAGLAARCGRAALDAAHALLDDPWAPLRRWPEEGRDILGRLSRPEWLLDGWDAIRALWRARGGEALHDMALLVPAMPTEAAEWAGFDAAGRTEALREGLRLWRRAAPPADGSAAAGRTADLTARNEGLRALYA